MNAHNRRSLSKSSDYLDALATTLRELGGPTTIPHELTQNADDAGNATTIRFTVTDDALTVWNGGTFTDCGDDGDTCTWPRRCDLHAFRRFAGRTKASDAATTGAFGVGFTSVYQITDSPELLYGDEHWVLDEMASEAERLRACDGHCGRTHGEPGTTFVLPWARTASPLRAALAVPPVDEQAIADLEAALLADAGATLLFLQHVTSLEVVTGNRWYRVHRSRTKDGLTIDDGVSTAHWLILGANFTDAAGPLIAKYSGFIDDARPTAVTIAVPVGSDVISGVLYATLPTHTPSGLPGHVNASFYPRTDRKTVRFEAGYDSDWNRAAISAVAAGLAGSAQKLADSLGIAAFWDFLGAITDFDRRVDSEQPNHASTYLEALRRVVPELAVVETIQGSRALPRHALLPTEPKLYEASDAFAKLGLQIVAQHLHQRLHTNTVYAEYGIRQLTARHIVDGLSSIGTTETFDPSTGPLTDGEVIHLLDALERLPGKVTNLDGAGNVALVPCRNGLVAPASDVVWPASEEDATLFEVLVDDLLIADVETIETHCPGLRAGCTPLDAAAAARVLCDVDPENLRVLAEDLLDWLNRSITAITDIAVLRQIAELPIFPTASGFESLTRLSLPTDFRDPIGVASLISESAAVDYHRLLITLGARPLEIVDYIRIHALPATAAESITTGQATELLKLIAIHQTELAGLREQLAAAPLVPCTDGRLYAAPNVHLPSRDIAVLAPELPIALASDVAPAVLDWLGVQRSPSDRALSIAVQRLASVHVPDAVVVEAVLRTLHARDTLPDAPPEFLTAQRWLALKRGSAARPSEVLPTNARHLYGAQGNELGLAPDVQGRYFQQLTWLGMPSRPTITTVVAHLKHCAATSSELHPDVYRELGNNVDQHVVRQLRETACVHVGQGRFVLPATAFWQQSRFGRWGTTLPEAWLPYKPFFDVVGVKQEPGPVETEAVLRAIGQEYGTDPVDQEGADAIHSCWLRLSELIDHPESSRVLLALGRIRSTLDPRGLLSRPDELFFEDSRALHKLFPLLAHNVIPRVHGTWPALARAGVNRVEELIRAKVIELDGTIDTELPNKIAERRSALRRVFDDDQVLDELEDLTILRAPTLQVSHRAELFGYSDEIGPEQTDAIYLPDENHLVYSNGASDRALARELARAIAPDEDPGPLAMRLEPVLSATSANAAHTALDDFGIAKLEASEHEVAWSPTAETGDVTADEDEGVAAAPDGDQEPEDRKSRQGFKGVGKPGGGAVSATTHRGSAGGAAGNAAGGGHDKSTGERTRRDRSDARAGRQTRLRSYVVYTDEEEGKRGTVGDEAPDLTPIDNAGVARVLAYERECGRDPHEMAHSNAGFDVESFDKHGQLVRRIEIKSTGGCWSPAGVMLSRRQHQQAVKDGDLFWLYVVENAQDDAFTIYRIQNPATRIDYFGFDGGWKDTAESDVDRDESGTPTARSTRNLLGRWRR